MVVSLIIFLPHAWIGGFS